MTKRGPYTLTGNDILASFKVEPFPWWENYIAIIMLVLGSHIIAYFILKIYGKRT